MNYYRDTLNENFFNEINSEETAYFLGLLFADGCVKDNKGNRQKTLTIALQEGDGYILEKLNELITPYKKVLHQKCESIISRGFQPRIQFNVGSDILCNDLIRHGCLINKTTLGLGIPNISKEYIHHFIRGFMDGNGGISVKEIKNTYTRKTNNNIVNPFKEGKLKGSLYFCSTDLKFIQFLDNVIRENAEIIGKTQNYDKETKNCTTYQIRYEHRQDITTIYNYLYNNATLYLERKFEKFNKLIKSPAKGTLLEGLTTT